MRRYRFLDKDSVFSTLNKLRASFLAAKDGDEVEQIINAILTHDEKMKIGRRIQVAEMLLQGVLYRDIVKDLKVGMSTVLLMMRKLEENKKGIDLVVAREEKVEREYRKKAYITSGPKTIVKRKFYTGYLRKDVKR